MAELSDLIIGKRHIELVFKTLSAHDGENGEANILYAVFAVEHGGNGESGINAAEQALADMAYGNSDSIEGSTLVGDYLPPDFLVYSSIAS